MSFISTTSTGEPPADPPKEPKGSNSKFWQQKLPAWKPLPTAPVVLPWVFILGAACVGIGVALLLASQGVQESFFTYGHTCGLPKDMPVCLHHFSIDADYTGDVYFYYYLSNYNQNLRRYFSSRNDEQLLGKLDKTSGCAPFDRVGNAPIVPCGAIANSIFNDTYTLTWNGIPVPLTSEGLLWDVGLFKNPPDNGGDFCSRFAGTEKPPNWGKPVCEIEGGLENVDLNIWMRIAGLNTFRKPWRKLNRSADPAFANGLPAGDYVVNITNRYPVTQFDGDKGFVVTTTSWAGGKNDFLAIAYLSVGGVILLLGLILLIVHAKIGHSTAELADLGDDEVHVDE